MNSTSIPNKSNIASVQVCINENSRNEKKMQEMQQQQGEKKRQQQGEKDNTQPS